MTADPVRHMGAAGGSLAVRGEEVNVMANKCQCVCARCVEARVNNRSTHTCFEMPKCSRLR